MTQLTLLNKKDYLLPSATIYIAKKAKWLKDKLNSLANRAKVVINEALHNIQLSIFKLKANWWVKPRKVKWALTDMDVKRANSQTKSKAVLIPSAHESLDASWTMYENLF